MFTIDDAKRMCERYDATMLSEMEGGEDSASYAELRELLAQFADDVLQQVRLGSLRKNAVYVNLIDHPAGFSFGFAPAEGKKGPCLSGKLYTSIYDGDYEGINQAGYAYFELPCFEEEVMEALKPLFGRPSPNGGKRFLRYTPPMMPPEKVDAFFEKEYLEIDWDTYGLTPENPILLTRVSHAYTYLKSLLFRGASICFHRVGSMSVMGKSHPVDKWIICVDLEQKDFGENGESFPFTFVTLYTYSYHVTSLLTIPPARGRGFEMNPMCIETYCPWEDEELASRMVALRKEEEKTRGGVTLCEMKGYDHEPDVKEVSKTLIEDLGGIEALEANTEKVAYLYEAWQPRFNEFIAQNPLLAWCVGIEAEVVKKLCLLDVEDLYKIVYESYVCPWNYLDIDNGLIISLDEIGELAARLDLSHKTLMAAAARIAQYLAEKGLFPLTGEEMERATLEALKARFEV